MFESVLWGWSDEIQNSYEAETHAISRKIRSFRLFLKKIICFYSKT